MQHNIRTLAKAYCRISFARLTELLGVDAPTAEMALSELASDKAVWAKIDRPAGVVVLQQPRPAAEVLTSWAHDINSVLGLVDKVTHLVQKDRMKAALVKDSSTVS